MSGNHLLPLGVAVLLALCSCGAKENLADALDIHTVSRGDLRITVRELGEIGAANNTKISSEMEGRATLIFLIPEGTMVEEGDKLAELDVSGVEDKLANQSIAVAKAEAALEQARKNLDIMENGIKASEGAALSRLTIAEMRQEKFIGQSTSAVHPQNGGSVVGTNREMIEKLRELLDFEMEKNPLAEVNYGDLVNEALDLLESDANQDLEMANQDLEMGNQDLEMGEMANLILRNIDNINLSRADLELAKDKLGHSERLYGLQFITENELESDKISFQRNLSKVTLAWNDLELLIKFTLQESKIQLRQDVTNAELDKKSVEATNEATRVRQTAEQISKIAEFDLAKEREDTYRQQIANAVIFAPTPGLVIFAQEGGGRGRQPVEEGIEIRERQGIINLPDTTLMVAEFKVHEAQVDQVAETQPAIIKVSAFPERSFTGKVSHVSALPDSGSRFTNSDLKVYKTTVTLDGNNADGSLRPGMNAEIEILVGELHDVLAVPVPGVQHQGQVAYVWKLTPDGPETVMVKIGANNLSHVEVVEGLEEGDRIYLGTPPGAEAPEFEQPESIIEVEDAMASEAGSAMPAGMNRNATGRPRGGRGGRGGGRGGRGNRGGGDSQFLGALRGFLVIEWPDRAEELQDPRNWFRMLQEPGFQREVEEAIQPNADLSDQWRAYRERATSRNRGGDRAGRGGDRTGRGRGGRDGR